MTKKDSKKSPQNKQRKIIITSSLIGLLLIIGVVSGQISYAVAYVKCGKAPINATNFAASRSYFLPGDKGYGPNFFNKDFFCSESEAQASGYLRTPLAN
jgi:hypothetical protein